MAGLLLFVLGLALGFSVSPWFFVLCGLVVLINIIGEVVDS